MNASGDPAKCHDVILTHYCEDNDAFRVPTEYIEKCYIQKYGSNIKINTLPARSRRELRIQIHCAA